MWPMLLDYTKDESKRILRRLELEAYASIISVFRAHGDLSKDKKTILQDLQQTLSISTERHRAEVRRAINDEKLATIAENISGTMCTEEWQVEGRRLVPLMPRLVPQTAFTSTANQAATAMMEKNATLPLPSSTGNKDGSLSALPKTTRPSSPSSNVVVLPSGTSIHIKGMLNQEEEELITPAAAAMSTPTSRRASQRSLSSDSQNAAGASVSTQTPRVTYTTASSTAQGTSPVKITISKSPQGRPISVQSNSQPPKVILVTSAGPAPTVRSNSVPIMRNHPSPMSATYPGHSAASTSSVPSSVGGPMAQRPPAMVPSGVQMSTSSVISSHHVVSTYPGAVTPTSGSSFAATTASLPSSSMSNNPPMLSPINYPLLPGKRPRIVPRQRYPAMVPQHSKPGAVIPTGPQLVSPLPHNVSLSSTTGMSGSTGQHVMGGQSATPGPGTHHVSAGFQSQSASVTASVPSGLGSAHQQHMHSAGVQVKTLTKPTIQINKEGIRLINKGTSSQILPKPQAPGSGNAPVVMVNTGQGSTQATTGITMLPRSISTYTAHSGGKVLNITTPGGRVIATTTKATNVVTVNPKTLHLTAVKSGSGSTTVSKPNVIVVQKTQHTRFQNPMGGNIRTVTTSTLPGGIDKELMGLVQHKDAHGRPVVSTASGVPRTGERRVIITTSGGQGEVNKPVSIIHRGRADSEGKTSSLLAELIQAAGIMPSDASSVETHAQGTDTYDFDNPDGGEQRTGHQQQVVTTPSGQVVFRQGGQSLTAAPGSYHIRSQQHLPHQQSQQQQQHQQRPQGDGNRNDWMSEDKGSSQDSDSGTGQVYTLEQAMSFLNKEVVDLTDAVDTPPKPMPVSAACTTPTSTPQQLPFQVSLTSTTTSTSITNSGTASILPNILNSVLGTPGQPQPKVSILAKSKLLSGVIKDPSVASLTHVVSPPGLVTPVTTTSGGGAGTVVSSEEGLKEGQLDTQTGLFYQVTSPATIKVGPPQPQMILSTTASLGTSSSSLLLSSTPPVVVIQPPSTVAGTAPPVSKLTTSTSPTTLLVSQAAHRPTPAAVAASVTTTSPLTVISARLPPSTLLTSSTSSSISSSSIPLPPLPPSSPPLLPPSSLASSSSIVAATVVKTDAPVPHKPLDLLSSSLAQAQINLHDAENEDEEEEEEEGEDEGETDINNVQVNESDSGRAGDDFTEEEDDGYDEYDEEAEEEADKDEGLVNSHVFQPVSAVAAPSLGESSHHGQSGRPGMAEVLREETAKDGTLILTVSNPASSQPDLCVPVCSAIPTSSSSPSSSASSLSTAHHIPTLVTLPSQLARPLAPPLSALPQSIPGTSPSNSPMSQFLSALESQPTSRSTPVTTATTAISPSLLPVINATAAGTLRQTATNTSPGHKATSPVGVLPITVSVEPPGSVIALNLDDLASQQIVLPHLESETNLEGSQDDLASSGSDADAQVRSSKRKRKHNSGYEEPSSPANAWAKAAANLLLKVARFKGSVRDKNEIPAAEWFTFPVDPMDAPDYYTVIESPMDFSTMRKKLEGGQYNSFEEFQSDMDLIRSNCYLYNSEGTKVRRDCDEVMAFYKNELLKMQVKQAFPQYQSPPKKAKEDKPPHKQ